MSNRHIIPNKKAVPLVRQMSFYQGQQVVVMKGWGSFTDRLQILSECLHYCSVHNADICIDWRDYMWGQEKLDFWDYFEIIDIPIVSLLEVISRVKQGAIIIPSVWNFENLATANENSYVQNPISNSNERINSEIIVNNGAGPWHIDNLITNLRLKKPIAEIISCRLNELEIPFTAIHLQKESKLTIEEAIKPAVDSIISKSSIVTERMYVLSECNSMIDLWVSKFPQTKNLYRNYDGEVEFNKVKKHNMNIDTITDFLIICFSSWSFGNSDENKLIKLATTIKQDGKIGISKWLNTVS